MGNWTPGPWVVVTGKNISVGPCPGQRVAICNYDNGTIERANAKLISSAPDLLEALVRALPTVEHRYHTSPDMDGSLWADVLACRAAIAKATGATP